MLGTGRAAQRRPELNVAALWPPPLDGDPPRRRERLPPPAGAPDLDAEAGLPPVRF